jgi:RHS repeat-associated protein
MGSFAATHFTFHQGFDSVGNRTELRAVHGTGNDFKNTYTFDKLRRLTEVTRTSQPGGSAVLPKRVALEYNALGQRTKISRFESTGTTNAVATTDFTYDFANRLSSIAHKKGTTNLNTHSYTYDPLSRLRSITSTLDGTINYTYDQRSQLTIADDGQPYSPGHPTRLGERYQYDANGNRVGTGFTVLADNDNRITAAPGETYTYDNEGNVISMITSIGVGSKSFQWDHRNRLTQSTVSTSSGIVTVNYAYDPFNRLVKRSTGFNTTYFGYDEGINPQLQMDTQSGNQITHRYLWSDQVDELFADEQRLSGLVPDTKWALSDHQGTIKDIADFNSTTGQTSVRHRAYDSFGNRKGSALPTDIVFGYTGKYFDETTGMQNSWNRWYSPKMGRFISQDPIGFAAGDANLYRYVGNSPTNSTDPSGLIDPLGPTRTRPWEFFDSWSESQRVAWLKNQWGRYGSSIEKAASKHGVPEDLLTVVVFNEMMDYSVWEWMGERMGFGSSCGPGQLTQKALVSHGIYPDSMKIDGQPRVGRYPPRIENEADAAMAVQRYRKWQSKYRSALNDPDTSIDLLAQLVGVYVQILKDKTNTTDGSWGLPNRVVSSVIGMPLSNDSADKFRLELSRCGRAKTRVSQSMMAVIQAMTNDTETVLTEEGINDNVLQHIWNAGGLHPYINNNQHK